MPGILVEIIGNASQFKKELEGAVASTNKANSGFSKMSKAAGVAGLAIAGGLAVGLDMSVKAAMRAQTETARLAQAFKTSGVSLDAYKGAIDSAEASSRSLGFSNEDVRNSLGSLIIATHSGQKAISDLSVAENIARFRHVDLASASKMLTMAMAGSQRATKQLGLSIQPVTTNYDNLKAAFGKHISASEKAALATAKLADKQATAAKVIDLVRQKLSGQADAYAHTAAGAMAQFHAQTQALEESLGQILLPVLTAVAGAFARVAGFLAQHTTLAKALVVAVGTLAAVLLTVGAATKIYAAGQAVIAAATGAWTAAQWLLNAALTANPIGIVVVAIAALVAGLILAYQHSATFRAIVTGAFDAVKTAAEFVLNFFRNNWPIIVTLISGPFAPIVALATNAFGIRSALVNAANFVLDFFRGNWKTIAVLISGPFAPIAALATNAFGVRDALIGAFREVKDYVVGVLGTIKADFIWFGSTGVAIWGKVAKAIQPPLHDVAMAFGEVLGVLGSILGVIDTIIDKIGTLLAKLKSIPGVGLIGSVIGKLQTGGLAQAGRPYIVGEKGPELFLPSVSGMVVPNSSLGSSSLGGPSASFGASGAGGITLNVNLSGTFLGDERERIAEQLGDAIHNALLRKQRRSGPLRLT